MIPWRRRRRASPWAGRDVSALVPVPRVASRPRDDGHLELLLPRFRSGPAARWLQPRLRPDRAHIRVRLDALGSFVWRQLDGRTPVGAVAARFAAAFPDEPDGTARVWAFLETAYREGLLELREAAGGPADGAAEGA